MSLSPSRLPAMLVGLALFFSGIAVADTLITKEGNKYEGTVTEEWDKYILTKPNGSKMTIPKSVVAEVQRTAPPPADPTPAWGLPGKPAAPPAGGKDHSSVSVDLGGAAGAGSTPAAAEKLLKVVATGAGEDPDKADQAAFSQAIEQAVGVLVDAETIVKNDQIVSDKVLTFSRGFIKSFEVVKRWKQDNLHYTRIVAVVETSKLGEKLTANNIAIREVPGELIARQIQLNIKNEDDAALMFKQIMDDFDMVKFTKVNIVGKPKIEREGANAGMTVQFSLAPDYTVWDKFAVNLKQFLPKVAVKRARVAMERDDVVHPKGETVKEQLTGKGVLIGLVANAPTAGKQIQWDVYLVPQTLETVYKSAPGGGNYEVAVVLLDKDDKEIMRRNAELKPSYYTVSALGNNYMGYPVCMDFWGICPFWNHSRYFQPGYEGTLSFQVSQEELGKLVRVAAYLENTSGNPLRSEGGEKTSRHQPTPTPRGGESLKKSHTSIKAARRPKGIFHTVKMTDYSCTSCGVPGEGKREVNQDGITRVPEVRWGKDEVTPAG